MQVGNTPGQQYADSFLYAPVFNFYPDYAGPQLDVYNPNQTPLGSGVQAGINQAAGTAYGTCNGADVMTQEFLQRFQTSDSTVRLPGYRKEN